MKLTFGMTQNYTRPHNMKGIVHSLVFGNWWVALGAASLVQMTLTESGAERQHLSLSAFVLGATVTVYCLNMLNGLKELRKSGTESVRHQWCMANEERLNAHLGAGAAIMLVGFFLLSHRVLQVLVPAAVVSLLYVSPLMRGMRLREVGPFKILWVATVWSAITVVLPLVEALTEVQIGGIAAMTMERWLFIFAITIPFDIRDIDNDRDKGIRTLPSMLGVRRSRVIASAAIICSLLMTFHRYSWDLTAVTAAYSTAVIVTMALIGRSGGGRGEMYYSFWMEGTMVVLAGLVVLASVL